VIGGRRIADSGEGVRLEIGPRPVSLLHPIRARGARPSRISFDLFLRDPVEPAARIVYRNAAAGEKDYRAWDFSGALDRAGWNPVSVTADDAPGFSDADEVGLLLACPVPNVIALRGARIDRYRFPARARQMTAALLRRQPLIASSINAVPSQRVMGLGFGFLLWAGGVIALGILLARRFLLRESLPIVAHATITLVVLYALADLRNSADLFLNAREAATMRLRSGTLVEYLARREQVFPWFADAVHALRTRVPADASVWFQVNGPPVLWEAVNRAWYYGQPARRASSLDRADVALIWGWGDDPLEGRPGWVLAERTPGGLVVYERIR